MTGKIDFIVPCKAYPGYGWDSMSMGFVRLPPIPSVEPLTPSQQQSERLDWDEYFFRIAQEVAARSTCPRGLIGVVLVDRYHRIVATGYPGAPSGESHCIEDGCLIYANHCIRTQHAERNAVRSAYDIVQLITDGYKGVSFDSPFLAPLDITPYIWGSRDACSECAGSMYRAGIRNEPKLRRAVESAV